MTKITPEIQNLIDGAVVEERLMDLVEEIGFKTTREFFRVLRNLHHSPENPGYIGSKRTLEIITRLLTEKSLDEFLDGSDDSGASTRESRLEFWRQLDRDSDTVQARCDEELREMRAVAVPEYEITPATR